jgi:hypothetical protein
VGVGGEARERVSVALEDRGLRVTGQRSHRAGWIGRRRRRLGGLRRLDRGRVSRRERIERIRRTTGDQRQQKQQANKTAFPVSSSYAVTAIIDFRMANMKFKF